MVHASLWFCLNSGLSVHVLERRIRRKQGNSILGKKMDGLLNYLIQDPIRPFSSGSYI